MSLPVIIGATTTVRIAQQQSERYPAQHSTRRGARSTPGQADLSTLDPVGSMVRAALILLVPTIVFLILVLVGVPLIAALASSAGVGVLAVGTMVILSRRRRWHSHG